MGVAGGSFAGSRQDERTAVRRRTLVDATLEVIACKGLSGLTLADVAREAACGYGLVLFHFKSKEQLLLTALETLVDEYELIWRRDIATAAGGPAEHLAAMLDLDFGGRVGSAKKIAVWTAFWAEAPRNPAFRRRCADLKRRYLDATRTLVQELVEAEGSRTDPAVVAGCLNAMIDGFWIDSQVTGRRGNAARARYKAACHHYLRSVFPRNFTLLNE